VTAAGCSNA